MILVESIAMTDNITDPTSRFVFLNDLMMLALSNGGKERSLGEYEALAKEAGFPTVKAFPFFHGQAAIELYKKV